MRSDSGSEGEAAHKRKNIAIADGRGDTRQLRELVPALVFSCSPAPQTQRLEQAISWRISFFSSPVSLTIIKIEMENKNVDH